ncbi:MAG: hypothetical protein ACU0FO_09175 [Pseudooceanicola nanhaiensis]|uniref:hypothetical protein n=1 Tax=Pseudooceanicola nanhaiensis TaxID=375761 RepID=UPI004058CD40
MSSVPEQASPRTEVKDEAALHIAFMEGVDQAACQRRIPQGCSDTISFTGFSTDVCETVLAAGGHLVLVYRSASAVIEADLAAGRALSDSLLAWQSEAEKFLDLRRRARRQVLLVGETALLHGDGTLLAPLAGLIGTEALADPLPFPDAAPSIFALLAEKAIETDPGLGAIKTELEARSLPAPEVMLPLSVVEAMAVTCRTQEETARSGTRRAAELATQLEETRSALTKAEALTRATTAERDLLKDHIVELHSEVQGHADSAKALQTRLEDAEGRTRAQAEALKAANARSTEALAEKARLYAALSEERDLLLAHIAELQRETDEKASEARSLTDRVAALTNDVGRTRLSGTALHQALTDELTAKLREARENARRHEADLSRVSEELAALRRDSANERQVQSAEMTRKIEAVQAEAQAARESATEAAGRIVALGAELAAVTAQKTHQSSRAARLEEELEKARLHWDAILKQAEQRELALRQGLEDLTAAYTRLMSSRSWKITEPLRAANRLLSRTNKGR